MSLMDWELLVTLSFSVVLFVMLDVGVGLELRFGLFFGIGMGLTIDFRVGCGMGFRGGVRFGVGRGFGIRPGFGLGRMGFRLGFFCLRREFNSLVSM